jgi:hypothetical protein
LVQHVFLPQDIAEAPVRTHIVHQCVIHWFYFDNDNVDISEIFSCLNRDTNEIHFFVESCESSFKHDAHRVSSGILNTSTTISLSPFRVAQLHASSKLKVQ